MFDISKSSIEQCEAMAYRTLVQIEGLQSDLKSLNQAIAQKKNKPKTVDAAAVVEPKVEEKPKKA